MDEQEAKQFATAMGFEKLVAQFPYELLEAALVAAKQRAQLLGQLDTPPKTQDPIGPSVRPR